MFLIVGGLFKKVIVANYLVDRFRRRRVPQPGRIISRLDLLLGMYAYALQIYCDFSAYTDIAIGIAMLLGYRFPQNFNQPYRALSVQDFWRRWHITLSSWLRDYLYIPLGGNRGGRWFTYRNIMITMVLGGLWHGASVNFVIWGVLHGAALVVERMLGDDRGGRPAAHPGGARLVHHLPLRLHHLGVLPCAVARSGDQPIFRTLLVRRRDLQHHDHAAGRDRCWCSARSPRSFRTAGSRAWRPATTAPRSPLKVAVPFVVIFLVAVAAPGGVPPFIYFQF